MRFIDKAGTRGGGLLLQAFRDPLVAALGACSEAVTVAAAFAVALLTLAQPAFHETGPDWLKRLDLSVLFLDRHGREIGRRGIRHDDTLRLDELPDHLLNAVLATEDRRFYSHWGIDPIGLVRALAANAQADGVVQGGSTITQQLAKNLWLTGERTLERKIKEAFLALWLEAQLTKPAILKLYLDRAYLGAGAFGVAAAADTYFGKPARDVTLAEAAILAGLFKAPSRYAPHLGSAATAVRANDVLDMMLAAGLVGRAEAEAAKREPAVAVMRGGEREPGHYLDWAYREVQRLAAAGRLGRDTVLTVETPLDPALQAKAESVLDATLDRDGRRLHVGAAAAVVADPDGAVRAIVGGRDYDVSQFNRATEARRQPGSAFKPFVYAAALAHSGFRPDTTVVDSEICIGRWCPSNYGRSFSGAMPLGTALARSVNTVAVRLTVEIGRGAGEWTIARQARYGRARTIELARALGLRTPLHDTPSLPLGASEVTLLDMTAAYAAFANGGLRAAPYAAVTVRNSRGQTVYRRDRDEPGATRVLGPRVVGDMATMLARAVEAGTARRAAVPGHAVAGKTGTTSAYKDAWFVGFTGQLVGGVWLGNDDATPTRQVTGGSLPAAAWSEIMAFAHRNLPAVALPAAEGHGWAAERGKNGFVDVAAAGATRAGPRAVFETVGGSIVALRPPHSRPTGGFRPVSAN